MRRYRVMRRYVVPAVMAAAVSDSLAPDGSSRRATLAKS